VQNKEQPIEPIPGRKESVTKVYISSKPRFTVTKGESDGYPVKHNARACYLKYKAIKTTPYSTIIYNMTSSYRAKEPPLPAFLPLPLTLTLTMLPFALFEFEFEFEFELPPPDEVP